MYAFHKTKTKQKQTKNKTKMKFKEEILNLSGCASSPDHLDTNDDLKKCGGCMLCKLHLDTSTKFTSSVTNETFTLDKKVLTLTLHALRRMLFI